MTIPNTRRAKSWTYGSFPSLPFFPFTFFAFCDTLGPDFLARFLGRVVEEDGWFSESVTPIKSFYLSSSIESGSWSSAGFNATRHERCDMVEQRRENLLNCVQKGANQHAQTNIKGMYVFIEIFNQRTSVDRWTGASSTNMLQKNSWLYPPPLESDFMFCIAHERKTAQCEHFCSLTNVTFTTTKYSTKRQAISWLESGLDQQLSESNSRDILRLPDAALVHCRQMSPSTMSLAALFQGVTLSAHHGMSFWKRKVNQVI